MPWNEIDTFTSCSILVMWSRTIEKMKWQARRKRGLHAPAGFSWDLTKVAPRKKQNDTGRKGRVEGDTVTSFDGTHPATCGGFYREMVVVPAAAVRLRWPTILSIFLPPAWSYYFFNRLSLHRSSRVKQGRRRQQSEAAYMGGKTSTVPSFTFVFAEGSSM